MLKDFVKNNSTFLLNKITAFGALFFLVTLYLSGYYYFETFLSSLEIDLDLFDQSTYYFWRKGFEVFISFIFLKFDAMDLIFRYIAMVFIVYFFIVYPMVLHPLDNLLTRKTKIKKGSWIRRILDTKFIFQLKEYIGKWDGGTIDFLADSSGFLFGMLLCFTMFLYAISFSSTRGAVRAFEVISKFRVNNKHISDYCEIKDNEGVVKHRGYKIIASKSHVALYNDGLVSTISTSGLTIVHKVVKN